MAKIKDICAYVLIAECTDHISAGMRNGEMKVWLVWKKWFSMSIEGKGKRNFCGRGKAFAPFAGSAVRSAFFSEAEVA